MLADTASWNLGVVIQIYIPFDLRLVESCSGRGWLFRCY